MTTNRKMTTNTPEAMASDLDSLTRHLLDVIARAPQDPLIKAFAAISAAAQVSAASAEASPALRVRLAKAALVLMQSLVPDDLVRDTPNQQCH